MTTRISLSVKWVISGEESEHNHPWVANCVFINS